ncbi:MAG: double-strand break repair protein AddB, partial [Pseudomonadota bacterium]
MTGELVRDFKPADDLLSLADATIYVPNRRAARALSTAFLGWFEGRATLLPTIRTLGDTDDLDFGLDGWGAADGPELLPISDLDRKLQLSSLIQGWKDAIADETCKLFGDEEIIIPTHAADSIRLADDLAILLTQFTQEELDWNEVSALVPEDHADWWRLTTAFLQIIMKNWPDHLAELGLLDPAEHAVRSLKARAVRYSEKGSIGPVIVAGSTGSVPSTQLLLKAVAGLPLGAVVLPGVDFHVPDAEWERLSDPNLP